MNYLFLPILLPLLICLVSPLQADPGITANLETLSPIYHIPLRVHLGNSDRAVELWPPILQEMNTIWLSQAHICFEIHVVEHDRELENGLDLWFESTIPDWNGYFTNPHDIHVRDNPDLRPAPNPAGSPAARTAAHELGHALGLSHRQDSDDNLMRSKTYGWHLNEQEILQAREAAIELASSYSSTDQCNPPLIQQNP